MNTKQNKYISTISKLLLPIFLLATNWSYLYAGSSKIYPIYPKTGTVLNSSQILFKWADGSRYGEYMYMLCFTDDIYNGTRHCEVPTSQQYMNADISGMRGYLYWFVAYQRRDEYLSNIQKYPNNPSFSFKLYSDIFVAGINKYVPYSIYSQVKGKTPGNFFRANDYVRNRDGSITRICRNLWSFKLSEYSNPKDSTVVWNYSLPKGSVLGASTVSPQQDTSCHFKFVKERNKKTITKNFCSVPNLSGISSTKEKKIVRMRGNYPKSVKVQIDVYNCVKKFYNPLSWFRCKEVFEKTISMDFPLEKKFQISESNTNIPTRTVSTTDGVFSIVGYSQTEENRPLILKATLSLNIPYYNVSEEAVSTYSVANTIQQKENNIFSKPFSFPFKRIIGVTQWYGYTAFQSPHTGIDFGSMKENTVAVDDGIVVAKGYDTYYGNCNSGGNYLTIKHNNGMHTVYFHLMESYVNIGDAVTKNQVIAKTGNTGKSECKPLGYHLHFETRKGRAQSTHDDPVKYIDVDWNNVLTLNSKNIPARLSGNNPHPGK